MEKEAIKNNVILIILFHGLRSSLIPAQYANPFSVKAFQPCIVVVKISRLSVVLNSVMYSNSITKTRKNVHGLLQWIVLSKLVNSNWWQT